MSKLERKADQIARVFAVDREAMAALSARGERFTVPTFCAEVARLLRARENRLRRPEQQNMLDL